MTSNLEIMKKSIIETSIASLAVLIFVACGQNQNNGGMATDQQASADSITIQTLKRAYVFGLPLVLMDITRRQLTDPLLGAKSGIWAPINQFKSLSSFPDASFKSVVRPNADTYYSTACLDLSREPIILSVPNTHGRYYMMPMLDAYTNVFASPGTRTTGNEAGNFLISAPGWNGTVPVGVKEIKAPTSMAWIIGRTKVNSKEDGAKIVVPIQKGYKLTPLSAWGKTYNPPKAMADSTVPTGSPNEIVKKMPVEYFFNYINGLMVNNPPADADKGTMENFSTIGVKPGGKFELGSFDTAVQAAIKDLPMQVFAEMDKELSAPRELENGWRISRTGIGTYGTNYTMRALVAYAGLGANLPQDAIYPSCEVDAEGNPLSGANKYTIHFEKGKTPPANAFWSLTMYDPDGFLVDNPINRYAVGDRSHLKFNADGSTDIYIQHESPGKDKENNWLPAPAGSFNVLMRIYWPKEEMINGSWKIPPVKKT